MSLAKLQELINLLNAAARNYDIVMPNVPQVMVAEPDQPWHADLLELITNFIAFNKKPSESDEQEYAAYGTCIRTLFRRALKKLRLLMERSDGEPGSPFANTMSNKVAVEVLLYFVYVDTVHQEHLFDKEKYRPLRDSIIKAAQRPNLADALAFMRNPQQGENYFTKLRQQIETNDFSVDTFYCYTLNLPIYVEDWLQTYFSNQLLIHSLTLPTNEERRQLVQKMLKKFANNNQTVDSFEKEFTYYETASNTMKKQCNWHGFYTPDINLWRQLYLELAELMLKLTVEFPDMDMLQRRIVLLQTSSVTLLMSIYLKGQYELRIIKPHALWKSACLVFMNYPLLRLENKPAASYLFRNALEITFRLFAYNDLQNAQLMSKHYLTMHDTRCVQEPSKDLNAFTLLSELFKPFSAEKQLKPISDMVLKVNLAQNKKEESDSKFCLRYLLNIFVAAAGIYLGDGKIHEAYELFNCLHKAVNSKVLQPISKSLAAALNSFNISLQNLENLVSLDKKAKLCNYDAIKNMFSLIDADVHRLFLDCLLAYIKRQGQKALSDHPDLDNHEKLVSTLRSFDTFLTTMQCDEDERNALDQVYQVVELEQAKAARAASSQANSQELWDLLTAESIQSQKNKEKKSEKKKQKQQEKAAKQVLQRLKEEQKKAQKEQALLQAKQQQREQQREREQRALAEKQATQQPDTGKAESSSEAKKRAKKQRQKAKKAQQRQKSQIVSNPEPVLASTTEPVSDKAPPEETPIPKTVEEKGKQPANTDVPLAMEAASTSGTLASPSLPDVRGTFFNNASVQSCFPILGSVIIPAALHALWRTVSNIDHNAILILTGGAAESLSLCENNDINDYDCILINCSLNALKSRLITQGYAGVEIIGKKVPVLHYKTDNIEIEIRSLTTAMPLYDTLKQDAAQRDVLSTGMYIIFSDSKAFELYDPLNMKAALDKKEIELNPQEKFFTIEPTRLLRVVNALAKRNNFKLSENANTILSGFVHRDVWNDYILNGDPKTCFLHRSRVNTALDKLLKRYKLPYLIEKMQTAGVLEGLTGLPPEQQELLLKLASAPSQQNIVTNNARERLFRFYLMNAAVYFHFKRDEKEFQIEKWPLYPLTNLSFRHTNFSRLFERNINNTDMPLVDSQDAVILFETLSDIVSASNSYTM